MHPRRVPVPPPERGDAGTPSGVRKPDDHPVVSPTTLHHRLHAVIPAGISIGSRDGHRRQPLLLSSGTAHCRAMRAASHVSPSGRKRFGPFIHSFGGIAACSRWWSVVGDTTGNRQGFGTPEGVPAGFSRRDIRKVAGAPAGARFSSLNVRWFRKMRSTTGYKLRSLPGSFIHSFSGSLALFARVPPPRRVFAGRRFPSRYPPSRRHPGCGRIRT